MDVSYFLGNKRIIEIFYKESMFESFGGALEKNFYENTIPFCTKIAF